MELSFCFGSLVQLTWFACHSNALEDYAESILVISVLCPQGTVVVHNSKVDRMVGLLQSYTQKVMIFKHISLQNQWLCWHFGGYGERLTKKCCGDDAVLLVLIFTEIGLLWTH